MNMESGSSLADFQDYCFIMLQHSQNLSSGNHDRLRTNSWVKIAERLSPCNLVIRHYCLLDIIEREPKRFNAILEQVKLLTYYTANTSFLLYAEGYSYWLYIKNFLALYVSRFPSTLLFSEFIYLIDRGFQATSYLHDKSRDAMPWRLYPAPFGDVRCEPLEESLQDRTKMFDTITVMPVSKNGLMYFVKSMPVKLNGHIQVKDSHVTIVDGFPQNFQWYHGYNEKYPTAGSRFVNTCNLRRIVSLFNS